MEKPKIYSTTPAASRSAVIIAAALLIFSVYFRLSWPFLLLTIYLSYLLWNYWWAAASSRSTTVAEEYRGGNIFAGETCCWEFKFTGNWFLPLVRCGLRFYLPSFLSCTGTNLSTSFKIQESDYISASDTNLPVFWNLHTVLYALLPKHKDFTVKIQVLAEMRGLYYLPDVHFFAGDPSGLYQGFKPAAPGRYLYVFPHIGGSLSYPKILALEENSKEDIFGAEDRSQAVGIRDFQPNDPPKSINWYATARTNSLKTNIYQHKDSAFCLVVFDFSTAVQPIVEPDSERTADPELEEAISIVCETALSHLEQGFETAFLTNAPILGWRKREQKRSTNIAKCLKRTRRISFLNYSRGTEQEQNILRLCSAIDDTARAVVSQQEEMWRHICEVPANTVVYIFGYHTSPTRWSTCNMETQYQACTDPASFYQGEKFASLAAGRVRYINLSKTGGVI